MSRNRNRDALGRNKSLHRGNSMQYLKAKTVSVLALVLALALMLSACGGKSDVLPVVLAFIVHPGDTYAGDPITPSVQVEIRDADGNRVRNAESPITLMIGANPGIGTLSGTLTVTAVDGVATFDGLSIDKKGEGYTLIATSPKMVPTLSNTFKISLKPIKLAFTVQPGNTTADADIMPDIVVQVQSSLGELVETANHPVTLAIGSNPAGGTLSGILTRVAFNGVATFPGMSIDKRGTGYTLTATAPSLTEATSTAFDILPKPAVKVVFSEQPSNTTQGEAITPDIKVEILNEDGLRVTTAVHAITLAISANPGSGVLSGTLLKDTVDGVAIFGSLSIDRPGVGYKLTATSPGLTEAYSEGFDILPRLATLLAFTVQPSNTMAGEEISPHVAVEIRDARGRVMEESSSLVTLALGNNPSGGTLLGTLTKAAVNGVATFERLLVDKGGDGYTLIAGSPGLTNATSDEFNIKPKPPARLAFSVQPANTTEGVGIIPGIVMEILDEDGNRVETATNSITLALGNNPSGGVLSGTLTVAAANGLATFNGVHIDKAGLGYRLKADAPGLTGATSTPFDILARQATKLAFLVQPGNTTAGEIITPSVVVEVQNELGQRVIGENHLVTLAISTNPGGGMLLGTITLSAAGGLATFPNLNIDKAGLGFKLKASAPNLTSADSQAFNILPRPATQLAFTVQPSNTVAGKAILPSMVVEVQNAWGQRVEGAAMSITLTLGTNPSGGALTGTLTRNAVDGTATFPEIVIDKAGLGYQLQAAADGLVGALSSSFDILPRPATKLTFTVHPRSTTVGENITPPVVVEILNELGQRVEREDRLITLTIGHNPSGGALLGTITQTAVNGRATFHILSIDKAGSGYSLKASASSLEGATSQNFNILPWQPIQLAFARQPVDTVAGTALEPALQVEVLDVNGLRVPTAEQLITLAISSNPGGGILSGTLTQKAAGGLATFPGLSIDRPAEAYGLLATATGLNDSQSVKFDILPRPATKLVFAIHPRDTVAGETLAPDLVVEIQNELGERITAASHPITLAIGSNPAGGTLLGTLTMAAVEGRATFPGLKIEKAGEGYTLAASTTGLTNATSQSFNINPRPAVRLAFTVEPSTTSAGEIITPDLAVEIQDSLGNRVTSAEHQVTLAIDKNPSHGVLQGTLTRKAVEGRALFTGLSIDLPGDGYALKATANGLTQASSMDFNILPRASTRLVFTAHPGSRLAGQPFSPDIVVEVQNTLGQLVSTATNAITLQIGDNPGNGTLSGTVTRSAVGGQATFFGLSIDKAGENYTLRATATDLASGVSHPFDISPLPAAQLAFTVQPGATTLGETIAPDLVVEIQDELGNRITTAGHQVTLAIGTNPGAGVLSGVLTKTAAAGRATFAGLSIDKAGVGYKLQATAIGLADGLSASFDILPLPPSQLDFYVEPSDTQAGQSIAPTVIVEIQNRLGERITNATHQVTLAIETNPSGGVLSGTPVVNAVNGFATFSDISINKMGKGYTLKASSGTLTAATSKPFEIRHGPPARVAFTVQPGTSLVGTVMPSLQLVIQDAYGNQVTTEERRVTLSLGRNMGKNVFHADQTSLNLVDSVSTRTVRQVASLDQPIYGYIAMAYNPQDRLIYAAYAGSGPRPKDEPDGNRLRTIHPVTGVQTVIAHNPRIGDLELRGFAFVDGVLYAAGRREESGSKSYQVNSAQLYRVNLSTAELSSLGGLTHSQGIVYQVYAMETDPTTGTIYAVAALSFSHKADTPECKQYLVTINPGTQQANVIGCITADGKETITGITFQPDGTMVGVIGGLRERMGSFVTIDKATAAVTPLMGPIHMQRQQQLTWVPAELNGTLETGTSGGVASFADLQLNAPGNGYTIIASVEGLTSVESQPFLVMSARPAKLVFTVQPADTTECTPIAPAVEVAVQNEHGVLIPTATNVVTMSLGSSGGGVLDGGVMDGGVLDGGSPAGVLEGVIRKAAVNGVAVFEQLYSSTAGNGLVLKAASRGLTDADSNSFNITAGSVEVSQLAFTFPPGQGVSGYPLPSFEVELRDGSGQPVTTGRRVVNIFLEKNPGTNVIHSYGCGGGGSSCRPVMEIIDHDSPMIIGPLPTFPANLEPEASLVGMAYNPTDGLIYAWDRHSRHLFFFDPVTGMTARIGAIGLNTIRGLAVKNGALYAVSTSNSNTILYTVDTATAQITQVGTGSMSNSLGGQMVGIKAMETDPVTNTIYAVAQINIGGPTNWYLGAIDETTNPPKFNVMGELRYNGEPNPHISGITFRPDGTMVGLGGGPRRPNTGVFYDIDKGSGNMTLLLDTGRQLGGNQITWLRAQLWGTTSVITSGGKATFNDLRLTAPASGYVLRASVCGGSPAISEPITVTRNLPRKLAFVQHPSETAACHHIAPSITVEVLNEMGDRVAGSSAVVTLSIGAGHSTENLMGTLSRGAVNGVATFDDISIDMTNPAYTLKASSPNLESAESNPFAITASTGLAVSLSFREQPTNTSLLAKLRPFTVELRDSSGQLVTSEDRMVNLSLANNPGMNVFHTSGYSTNAVLELVEFNARKILPPLPNGASNAQPIVGLAYNPQDGLIYGSSSGDFFSITPHTGISTYISTTQVMPLKTPRGFAFKNGGLYVSGFPEQGDARLHQISLATGEETGVCNLTSTLPVLRIYAMETEPSTGIIWGIANISTSCTYNCLFLVQIDPDTCQVTVIGNELTDNIFGITFVADGTLLGVTADGGTQGETLFRIDMQSAALTYHMALGNGEKGEQITWVPARLGGTVSVRSANGVATFDSVVVNSIANGYTIEATSCGLQPDKSTPFNVSSGP